MRMTATKLRLALFCGLVVMAPRSADASTDGDTPAARGAAQCKAAEVGVQVLGSGGPIAEGSRAGSSYAVWIDGRARLLIDAGPGSFVRFGEAGLKVSDLSAIALSHFHADHTGGLAGILNSGSFEESVEPLPVIGPAAGSVFPGTSAFLAAQFGRDDGAWSYLGGYLDASDDRRPLVVREVPATNAEDAPVEEIGIAEDVTLEAIPVHHGVVPSLAYIVRTRGRIIVFAGDQSAASSGFDRFVSGLQPDLLIAHHVIPEGEGQPVGLHRSPGDIGLMAANMVPRRLLLSHHMNRSFSKLDEGLAAISRHFAGVTMVAADGTCVSL
ncbi:MAG: hypothetical protein C0465_25145 [Ralstonia sp.]|nr:hypothetical protein [Erythrobacter sp.]MBA4233861.1 hypothetical protein [Ralstonia sp.]